MNVIPYYQLSYEMNDFPVPSFNIVTLKKHLKTQLGHFFIRDIGLEANNDESVIREHKMLCDAK